MKNTLTTPQLEDLHKAAPRLFEALEHLKNRMETIQETNPEIALENDIVLAYGALGSAFGEEAEGSVERVKKLFYEKLAVKYPDHPFLSHSQPQEDYYPTLEQVVENARDYLTRFDSLPQVQQDEMTPFTFRAHVVALLKVSAI